MLASIGFQSILNAQRIFQIDANFGATSAVAEMLVQSHQKDEEGNFIIYLLSALPEKWNMGSVEELRTRGGFVVDMSWEELTLKSASMYSPSGRICKVRYEDKTFTLNLELGERKAINEF